MVFQPFLDQSLQRPPRRRGYLVSLALHGLVGALIWAAWGRAEPGDSPGSALVTVAAFLRQPNLARGSADPQARAPAEGSKKAGSGPAARRMRALAAPIAVPVEPPVTAEPLAEEEGDDQPGALDGGEDLGPPQGSGAGAAAPTGQAEQSGGRATGRRPVELFGRVVGGGGGAAMGPRGLPYAALKESTELRTYDVFPPLPASQWPIDRPYLVVLDVCVSGDGQVSDVALVRPASRVFDPLVVDAVRTWRYRPRLVDGQAQAFCHVVAIKYERL
jgi:hypothetical protein